MPLPLVLSAVALLIVLIALTEAGAARLSLPQSVMLAALGILLGALAAMGPSAGALAPVGTLFSELPLSADALTLLLLPPLLFEAAFRIDARRLLDDGAAIFLLAVVAVCVSTFAVGYALSFASGWPVEVCLLLGAIISTTDPLAVLSIFRDVGAPARLTRIVEGESLFNDAAAIALFTVLIAAAEPGGSARIGDTFIIFLVSGGGGLAVGALLGWVGTAFIAVTRNHAAALMSVTVALPYLAFIVCQEVLDVSGAVAVVTCGLAVARSAQSGRAPAAWRHVHQIWDQLSFWSNSLVFVLAAFLVPKLLSGFDLEFAIATAVVVVAAFGARALVLWGFLPLLQLAALAHSIDHRAKTLLWWGGLRGALTLLLALSVTEHDAIPKDAQEFVAVLATAFTLFTILVNGLTLRPLTRLLGLHRLGQFDRSLSAGARALATATARERVMVAAAQYGIAPTTAERALAAHADHLPADGAIPIAAKSRLALALVVLAQAERTALLRHGEDAVISPGVAERLNREAQRMREAARAAGRSGYLGAAGRMTLFSRRFRLALALQRWIGWRAPLSAALAERFEGLLVRRMVLSELVPYCETRIAPVMGPRVAAVCRAILDRRANGLESALAALGLQYPHYAVLLEQRFLERIALTQEHREYQMLRAEGIIGAEVSTALEAELAAANRRATGALRLDLSVDKRTLVAAMPLFSALPREALDDIARLLRTRVVVPGERIIRRGERGDEVYFIASGAVEVDTGTLRVTLGRGACVGELAAFSGAPRSADVTMLGFGELLVLSGRAFRTLLDTDLAIRQEVERIVAARQPPADPAEAVRERENLPVRSAGQAPAGTL